MKVDFFIVGVPKSGTTSLYHYLNEHPDIVMSRKKEPNYFSSSQIKKQQLYYNLKCIDKLQEYHNLFPINKKKMLYGESSVSYLFYSDVATKIKKYNSSAKIIVLLRNPIDRAFSHYLMDLRLGLVLDDFEQIINCHKERDVNLHYQQYITLGQYMPQLRRYIDLFGMDNILVVDYENFKNHTKNCVRKIYKFLDVDDNFIPDFKTIHNRFRKPRNRFFSVLYTSLFLRRIFKVMLPLSLRLKINNLIFTNHKKPKLDNRIRMQLKSIFEEDIKLLSKELNKDFLKWIR